MDKTFKPDILKGKVAVLTGGGRGILSNIAETFLRHGAAVAILSRNEQNNLATVEKLKATTGNDKCFTTKCDVRNYADIEAALDKVLERFQRIDILVNGAAGNFLAGIDNLSSNAFRTVLEIDTLGTFNASKGAYTKWMKQNGGNIINISATLHHSGTALQSHSGAAKAAVDALTKHLAVELGPKSIRVNGISPGPVEDTEGFSRLSDPKATGTNQDLKEMLPLQTFPKSEDISATALFLVSDAARCITGQTIVVDAGQVLTCPNFTMLYDSFRKSWKAKL